MQVTDAQIEILCIITTRDESGVHFTQKFDADDLIELETAGLIEVSRPIHQPSGIMYDRDQWTVEVTQEGLELVEANPELHPSDDINTESEAYNTGFEAKEQGEPRKANPYQNGSWDSLNWFAGWDEA